MLQLGKDIFWQSDDGVLSVRYSILRGGQEVYRGLAQALPDDDYVTIRLNDIFADNLLDRHGITFNTNGYGNENGVETFIFRDLDQNKDYEYKVVVDYSEGAFSPIASDPIVPIFDKRQSVVYTIWDDVTVVKEYASGSKTTENITVARTYYTNHNLKSLRIYDYERSVEWEVKDTCAKYAIYYINARGGWDSLVLGGRCSYTDKYTRAGYKRTYTNTIRSERGKINYLNEIVRTYTLRTSLLTDEQAAKMHHLLGTNMAILYDLETKEEIPVTITNSSYEVKTYKGNGRKMSQYEITAEYAQDIIRR